MLARSAGCRSGPLLWLLARAHGIARALFVFHAFRELAPDYGVSHTALSRYFARPEARTQLKQAEQLLRAAKRAAAARRSAEQREVRGKATQQAALERQQLRQSRAVQARIAARHHHPSAYEAWLDEHDR